MGPSGWQAPARLTKAALANLLEQRDDDLGAIRHQALGVEITKQVFDADSQVMARSLNDLGYTYLGTAEQQRALPYLERACAVGSRNLRGEHDCDAGHRPAAVGAGQLIEA
ncbi:tetratricopeptide repeat protein [Pseudonocardia sp. WMMC193]|uniref:tetratricopeptide repeat protein n=1 Tax=Pseudonocardia sp. WMMC193 TaxID=2911965 RepID=UPI001F2481B3|nr:tetratricopeptide repeat protein [Pseudonocardia sp. WMMC193]MCF7553825.1 tetratricopeptide repeat protein [Pseudonocardia sp. WMMC193]